MNESINANLWCLKYYRTLVYLEGDASMDVYEAQDGQKRSSLNVVQSKVEVLKRPVAKEEGSA